MLGRRVFDSVARGWSDRRGNVAMMAAGVIVAIAVGAGAMIDYGRSYQVRTALQSALDAAIVASALAASGDQDESEAHVRAGLVSNWKNSQGTSTPNLVEYSENDGVLFAAATVEVPASFLGIAGIDTVPVRVETRVQVGLGKMEIALVLDNTGSMSGSKLAELDDAATDLVNTLMRGGNDDAVKIAVVPFANYVNVGLANRNASWIDVPPDTASTETQCEMRAPVTGQSNCRTETATYDDDGRTVSYDYEVCDYTYGTPVEECWQATTGAVWQGCVGSRNHPLDVSVGNMGTRVPGLLGRSCPSAILPLTNDKSTITTMLDSLQAVGNTYIPAGLVWGWRALDSEAPFTEATSTAEATQNHVNKVIVLMTDGENTRSPSYPDHDLQERALADQRTAELCTNIKAAGIKIYTVTFDVSDNGIKDLMESCASGPPYYFDATGVAGLNEAFKDIAGKLVQLRIAG
ncbi:MAG: VWA domain-containing protein [Rhizobiales bacterium]|nr:VWA domain-containing protein [Hyphomicrobiales bacterium]